MCAGVCLCVYCTQKYTCLCMLSPINIRRQSRLTTVTTTTRRLRGIYECFALSFFAPLCIAIYSRVSRRVAACRLGVLGVFHSSLEFTSSR